MYKTAALRNAQDTLVCWSGSVFLFATFITLLPPPTNQVLLTTSISRFQHRFFSPLFVGPLAFWLVFLFPLFAVHEDTPPLSRIRQNGAIAGHRKPGVPWVDRWRANLRRLRSTTACPVGQTTQAAKSVVAAKGSGLMDETENSGEDQAMLPSMSKWRKPQVADHRVTEGRAPPIRGLARSKQIRPLLSVCIVAVPKSKSQKIDNKWVSTERSCVMLEPWKGRGTSFLLRIWTTLWM